MLAQISIVVATNMAIPNTIRPLAQIAASAYFSSTSVDTLLCMGFRILKPCLMQLIMNYFAVLNYPLKNCCRLCILQGF